MQIAASAASGNNMDSIVESVLNKTIKELGALRPNIGFIFCSAELENHLPAAIQQIRSETAVETLLGCTAEGVIGPESEFERLPSLSLWLAHLPNLEFQPFQFTNESLRQIHSENEWLNVLQTAFVPSHLLLLGDPFSLDVETLLKQCDEHLPGTLISGGMCSGGHGPGTSKLIYNDQILNEGAIGIALSNQNAIETIVSQGCRPIGSPLLITDGDKNVIKGLSGRNPIEVVNEMLSQISDEDRALLQNGLFVGRVIDEYKAENVRGDFLIRNIMGVDQETGHIAVMDRIMIGRTIQFHIRDAVTADEDLRCLLKPYHDEKNLGALLFSCNGRGTRMYDDPNHDLTVIQDGLNSPPIGGFFCAGELGPVGGNNFIHGHTISMALFRNLP